MIKLVASRATLRLAGAAAIGAALGIFATPSKISAPSLPILQRETANVQLPPTEDVLKTEAEKLLSAAQEPTALSEISPAAGE